MLQHGIAAIRRNNANPDVVARRDAGDVQLTPTTYLVNKRGEIVKRYVGEPDFVALHQLIEKLLAES